jgi:hypothetical protein
MSLKICCSEAMISDTNGVGMRLSFFPRVVAEAFLTSTKDGTIERAPDPVTMIDGSLSWFNNSNDDQMVMVNVHKASRSIVTTNPVTVVIHDAWSFDVGVDPQADLPSAVQDAGGGRVQIDRQDIAAADVQYGKFFLDLDDYNEIVPIGLVKNGNSLSFRYQAQVQTPGTWTLASGFQPDYEATANWTRLQAIAWPVGST